MDLKIPRQIHGFREKTRLRIVIQDQHTSNLGKIPPVGKENMKIAECFIKNSWLTIFFPVYIPLSYASFIWSLIGIHECFVRKALHWASVFLPFCCILRIECLSIPSVYRSTSSTHVLLLISDKISDRENPMKGSSAVPALSPWKFPTNVGANFAHFQSHHTQIEYKRKTSTEPKSCLTTKFFLKCKENLCLMIAPPIGQGMAERNRTTVFASRKHSMLISTSVSDD